MTRWTTDLEIKTLKKYAELSTLGIVEIGVFDGETTKEMASVTTIPIYGIDPIIPDSMPPYVVGSEENIKNNMRPFTNFTFYRDFSYNIIKRFSFPYDLLFIDGDHNYDAVKKDFTDWFPNLSIGGYIIIHDSAPVTSIQPSPFGGWEGPTRLVKELANYITITEIADTMTIFRKMQNALFGSYNP